MKRPATATLVAALLANAAPLFAQSLVVTHASIIDASPATPLRTASIVVQDGLITAIGASPAAPSGAHTIDARGIR